MSNQEPEIDDVTDDSTIYEIEPHRYADAHHTQYGIRFVVSGTQWIRADHDSTINLNECL